MTLTGSITLRVIAQLTSTFINTDWKGDTADEHLQRI